MYLYMYIIKSVYIEVIIVIFVRKEIKFWESKLKYFDIIFWLSIIV